MWDDLKTYKDYPCEGTTLVCKFIRVACLSGYAVFLFHEEILNDHCTPGEIGQRLAEFEVGCHDAVR